MGPAALAKINCCLVLWRSANFWALQLWAKISCCLVLLEILPLLGPAAVATISCCFAIGGCLGWPGHFWALQLWARVGCCLAFVVAVLVGLASFGPCSFGPELDCVWLAWGGLGWLLRVYGGLRELTGAWPFYTIRAVKITSVTTHGVARKQHFGGLRGPGHFIQRERFRLPLGNHERTL